MKNKVTITELGNRNLMGVAVRIDQEDLWSFLHKLGEEFRHFDIVDTLRSVERVVEQDGKGQKFVFIFTIRIERASLPELEIFIASYNENRMEIAVDSPRIPTCPACGHKMVVNGSAHKCLNCGESAGCVLF